MILTMGLKKKYGIYKVHFKDNDKNKYIDEVEVHEYTYFDITEKFECTGNKTISMYEVIEMINNEIEFFTEVGVGHEKYVQGSKVEIYIRTESNKIEKDNLDKLPTYEKINMI